MKPHHHVHHVPGGRIRRREQCGRIVHNRAVIGSAPKMRKSAPPFDENSAKPQVGESSSATWFANLQGKPTIAPNIRQATCRSGTAEMYHESDGVAALHRRAVRLRTAPTVTTALIVALCGTAGVAQADPTPADGPRTTIDSDGTYGVGTEIAPGTYSSAGPVGDSACYWKRLNGSTVVDDALSKKPQVVQIDSVDTAFQTDHCKAWQKLDCAASCPPAAQASHDVVGELRGFLASHP